MKQCRLKQKSVNMYVYLWKNISNETLILTITQKNLKLFSLLVKKNKTVENYPKYKNVKEKYVIEVSETELGRVIVRFVILMVTAYFSLGEFPPGLKRLIYDCI